MELYLDDIKSFIFNFENDVKNRFVCNSSKYEFFFKIRIVTFGDSSVDKMLSIKLSPSFCFRDKNDHDFLELKSYVNGIRCLGGFYSSDSLRALSMILQEDWTHRSDNVDSCRNIVFVFSKTCAIRNPEYESLLIEEVKLLWNESNWKDNTEPFNRVDDRGKRLVLYTKVESPWTDIYDSCDKVIFCTLEKDVYNSYNESYNEMLCAIYDNI